MCLVCGYSLGVSCCLCLCWLLSIYYQAAAIYLNGRYKVSLTTELHSTL